MLLHNMELLSDIIVAKLSWRMIQHHKIKAWQQPPTTLRIDRKNFQKWTRQRATDPPHCILKWKHTIAKRGKMTRISSYPQADGKHKEDARRGRDLPQCRLCKDNPKTVRCRLRWGTLRGNLIVMLSMDQKSTNPDGTHHWKWLKKLRSCWNSSFTLTWNWNTSRHSDGWQGAEKESCDTLFLSSYLRLPKLKLLCYMSILYLQCNHYQFFASITQKYVKSTALAV